MRRPISRGAEEELGWYYGQREAQMGLRSPHAALVARIRVGGSIGGAGAARREVPDAAVEGATKEKPIAEALSRLTRHQVQTLERAFGPVGHGVTSVELNRLGKYPGVCLSLVDRSRVLDETRRNDAERAAERRRMGEGATKENREEDAAREARRAKQLAPVRAEAVALVASALEAYREARAAAEEPQRKSYTRLAAAEPIEWATGWDGDE